jgi:tRNA(His) 5'-end guanylyltransferase
MKNAVRDKKSLGDRMKEYEKSSQYILTKRTPIIMRLDGRAFHTVTKDFVKPYDIYFMQLMDETAQYLCKNIQGAKIAYVQSDEITILIKYYDELNSEPWFGNELIKMVSISSALASSYLTYLLPDLFHKLSHRGYYNFVKPVQFDCRAFTIPEDEVCNNFIWRQQDWERNSVQMFGLSHFSQKELHKKSCKEIIRKCEEEKGARWDELGTQFKRGRCVRKEIIETDPLTKGMRSISESWVIDKEIPRFQDQRDFIERYLRCI